MAELLPVPGAPKAQPTRPEHSPGRIPVHNGEDGDTVDMARKVDKEVRESREYQILKPYMRHHHDREHDHEKEPEARDEADREQSDHQSPAKPLNVAPSRPETSSETDPQTEAAPEVNKSDPLALDLDGNGLQTSGIANGVSFDIDADGRLDQTSFIAGNDAFVALDRNSNGLIDDGRELFGDQNGHANGFDALATYDSNGDGRIDNDDPIYDRLRLLRMSADGSQQLTTLRDAGVAAISLSYQQAQTAINRYDSIAQTGSFTRLDGSLGEAGDLLLGHREKS